MALGVSKALLRPLSEEDRVKEEQDSEEAAEPQARSEEAPASEEETELPLLENVPLSGSLLSRTWTCAQRFTDFGVVQKLQQTGLQAVDWTNVLGCELLSKLFPPEFLEEARVQCTEWLPVGACVTLFLALLTGHLVPVLVWLSLMGLVTKSWLKSGTDCPDELRRLCRLWLGFVGYQQLEFLLSSAVSTHPFYLLLKWSAAHSLVEPSDVRKIWNAISQGRRKKRE